MNNEHRTESQVKKQLEKELNDLQFVRQEQILRRTHPKAAKDKFQKCWNKEIEIPVVPVFSVLFVLIGIGVGSYTLEVVPLPRDAETQNRELVDTGVGIYWSDVLDKVVSRK